MQQVFCALRSQFLNNNASVYKEMSESGSFSQLLSELLTKSMHFEDVGSAFEFDRSHSYFDVMNQSACVIVI